MTAALIQVEVTGCTRPVVHRGSAREDGLKSVLGDDINCIWEWDGIFFNPFNKQLVSCYSRPNSGPGYGNTTVNKTYKIPVLFRLAY